MSKNKGDDPFAEAQKQTAIDLLVIAGLVKEEITAHLVGNRLNGLRLLKHLTRLEHHARAKLAVTKTRSPSIVQQDRVDKAFIQILLSRQVMRHNFINTSNLDESFPPLTSRNDQVKLDAWRFAIENLSKIKPPHESPKPH